MDPTSPADGPALEPLVLASWQRSLEQHHVVQEGRQAPSILTAQELAVSRAPLEELIRVAREENDRLYTAVGKVGYALLFTSPEGVVVDVRGEPGRVRQFQAWGIWQGGVWSESTEGTNGIGTCIAEKRPITVHRAQHYRARHAPLSCCAAPVCDSSGNLVAVVDVSSYEPEVSDRSHGLALALTIGASRAIEERLFRHTYRRAWILCLVPASGGQPLLLAVEDGERIVRADSRARAALKIDEASLAGGLSLWRFFDRSPALFAPRGGDSFARLNRIGEAGDWHVIVTPPNTKPAPRAPALDLGPRVLRGRELAAPGGASLTERERAILELVADGQSNKEIARTLGISPETVKTHLENVFNKLSVERRAQAIARAKDLGLVA